MDSYLYISNRDSAKRFLTNKPDYFVIDLEQEFCLKGNWKVAITDITIKLQFGGDKPTQLCVLLDICEPTFVRGHYKQILRRINVNDENTFHATYSRPYFVNINVLRFKNFTVTVLNENLDLCNLEGDIFFTLLLKKS